MNGNDVFKSELLKKYLPDLDYVKKNNPRQYEVWTLDLMVARMDEKKDIIGNCLTVTVLPVEANKYVRIRLNSKENDLITLKEGRKIEATIHSVFVTNTAYTSGTLEIVVCLGLSINQ